MVRYNYLVAALLAVALLCGCGWGGQAKFAKQTSFILYGAKLDKGALAQQGNAALAADPELKNIAVEVLSERSLSDSKWPDAIMTGQMSSTSPYMTRGYLWELTTFGEYAVAGDDVSVVLDLENWIQRDERFGHVAGVVLRGKFSQAAAVAAKHEARSAAEAQLAHLGSKERGYFISGDSTAGFTIDWQVAGMRSGEPFSFNAVQTYIAHYSQNVFSDDDNDAFPLD